MMSRRDWLKQLQPGDEVVVSDGITGVLAIVGAITDTTIVVSGTSYSRATGRECEQNIWAVRRELRQATPEAKDAIEYLFLIRRFVNTERSEWGALSLEQARAIAKMLDEATGEARANDD